MSSTPTSSGFPKFVFDTPIWSILLVWLVLTVGSGYTLFPSQGRRLTSTGLFHHRSISRPRYGEPPCSLGTSGNRPRKPQVYKPDFNELGRVAGLLCHPSMAPPSRIVIGGSAMIDRETVHSLQVYEWKLGP